MQQFLLFLKDILNLYFECFSEYIRITETLPIAFGVSLLLSAGLTFGVLYLPKLRTSAFEYKIRFYILAIPVFVSLFILCFSLWFFQSLDTVALAKINTWHYGLLIDGAWQNSTFETVREEVQASGLENFEGVANNSIPCTKSETEELAASIYANAAAADFGEKHPLLNLALWGAEVPDDAVKEDIHAKLGDDHISQNLDKEVPHVIQTGDDDFSQRLNDAGAKTGNIQISLKWDNENDLDLHVFDPNNQEIYFSHKHSASGGELDVDANGSGGRVENPVENVYWQFGQAPSGNYKVVVKHYSNHGAPDPTIFTVRVKINGELYGDFTDSLSAHGDKVMCEFPYTKPQQAIVYKAEDAVALAARTIHEDLETKTWRVVLIASLFPLLLLLVPILIGAFLLYKAGKLSLGK